MGSRRCLVDDALDRAGLSEADRAEIDTFRRYLRGDMSETERHAYTVLDAPASDLGRVVCLLEIVQGRGTLREAREAAGLSLGQAARVTGIDRARLEALEGGAAPTEGERATLLDAYDVAGWQPGGGHV